MNHSTAHPPTEEQDHPHSCSNGWVTIGHLVVDPETGEEVEEYALYLCRRCADAAEVVEAKPVKPGEE